jgi:hypothetical protein
MSRITPESQIKCSLVTWTLKQSMKNLSQRQQLKLTQIGLSKLMQRRLKKLMQRGSEAAIAMEVYPGTVVVKLWLELT